MKKRSAIILGTILTGCLLFLLWSVGKPAYDRYIENDHAQTCEKARFVIMDHYNHAVEKLRREGTLLNEIDYTSELNTVLQDLQQDFPDMTVTPSEDGTTITITNLCRSGGTITLTMDPASHKLDTTCDIHGEYNIGLQDFK